jgi:chromosomal replication initiator protein
MTTPAAIITAVSLYFGVEVRNLRGPRRWKDIAHARHVGMYLTRHLTDLSYPRIGAWFGGRDHVTVMKAVEKIRRLVEAGGPGFDAVVAEEAAELRAQLEAGAPLATSKVGPVAVSGNAPDTRAA